jgi:drug/metabolite transporter (DMT)-like permease
MHQKSMSLALGLITIFCWGSLATFGHLLVHLPPFYILAVTFLIGSLPGIFKLREVIPPFRTLILGVTGYFGYHFFLFYSFRLAPAIEANLINYLWPVFMVFFTPLFFKETKLKLHHFLGGLLATTGSVVLVASKGLDLELGNLKGYSLALCAALTWPLYSIGKKKLPPTSMWAISSFCFFAGILCLVTHFLIEPHVVLQPRDAWLLFFMGIGPFGVAFYCWDLALKNGDARLMGALAYLTPVLSTLGLIFFAQQSLDRSTLVAMLLIIGGTSTGLLDFIPRKR